MTAKYRFVPSAASGAWMIRDSDGHPVDGSVFETIGGGFAYERGRWNGERQVLDHLRAKSMELLGERIESYLATDAVEHAEMRRDAA